MRMQHYSTKDNPIAPKHKFRFLFLAEGTDFAEVMQDVRGTIVKWEMFSIGEKSPGYKQSYHLFIEYRPDREVQG